MRHETRPERFCFAARRAGHRPACRDGRRARLRPVRGTLRGHLREHGGIGRLPRSALHPQPRLPELRRQAAPPLPTGRRLLYRPRTTGDRRAPPLPPRRVGAAGSPLSSCGGCGMPPPRAWPSSSAPRPSPPRPPPSRRAGGRLEPPRRGGEEGIARGACARARVQRHVRQEREDTQRAARPHGQHRPRPPHAAHAPLDGRRDRPHRRHAARPPARPRPRRGARRTHRPVARYPPGGRARLVVADTGCGISAADLPHIYTRFWRADASRSLPGNGLGLALVKAIVTSYGGRLHCDSVPGQGSAFTVVLPTDG